MGYPAQPTMRIYITSKYFILQTPDLGARYQFIIERFSSRCYCTENFNPTENGVSKKDIFYLDIFMIAGLVPIDSTFYIILVTEASIIDSLQGHNIYEIKGIEMIPIEPIKSSEDFQSAEKQSLYRLLSSGFYFSYYYDLTRSLDSKVQEGNLHERANKSFYWNYELYRDFLSQSVDTQWLIPIIQGYIGISTVNHKNETLILALISRRSCDRTGTRYNCRGLDDEGNVANYVETEQILIFGSHVFSSLQIRGSVPLFWEQTGYSAQVALTRSRQMNLIGFKKHINQLFSKYSKVSMINLMSNSKADERVLTKEWEETYNEVAAEFQNKLFYNFFDFHQNCKGNKFSNISEMLIKDLQEFIDYYGFFYEAEDKQRSKQKGIMRANCLDCLDRTNVVQSYIGWAVLYNQLEQIKMNVPRIFDSQLNLPLTRAFKNLWADNGDRLSLQYTGTGSTISSVTREGKQGFRGMISHGLKSIGRFYNATVEDAAKQKTIDALLRKKGKFGFNRQIEEALMRREPEYAEYSSFSFRAITWNLAGRKVPEDYDCSQILYGMVPADIISISFQEVVKLNTRTVLQESSNQKNIENLERVINKALAKSSVKYDILLKDDLVGIALFVFVKVSILNIITKTETDTIKVGFGGKMGNKGGVVGRFNLLDTTICILGCHLASGNEENEARKSQLADIHSKAFQREGVGKQNTYSVMDHDLRFIQGDLNFRINLPNLVVRKKITEGNIEELLENDQLIEALRENLIRYYVEPEVQFIPTYKFDFGTCIYDTSKKQRAPAWCDRILFGGEKAEVNDYNIVDVRISDHRPVYCDFRIYAKKINVSEKRRIEEELYGCLSPEIVENEEEEFKSEEAFRKETPKKEVEYADLLSL